MRSAIALFLVLLLAPTAAQAYLSGCNPWRPGCPVPKEPMCSERCRSGGYTISVDADGRSFVVEATDIEQNTDAYTATSLCGGAGYFPGPCPSGARVSLINQNAQAHDEICDINGNYLYGTTYKVTLPSSISSGSADAVNADAFCGSGINLMVDRYNALHPKNQIPQCHDYGCVGKEPHTGDEGGSRWPLAVTLDDWLDSRWIVEGIGMPGSKSCTMAHPAGPIADGYSGAGYPPAKWTCPAGTVCSTTTIGGCDGSTYSGLTDRRGPIQVAAMVAMAQKILTSKAAQACLANGRLIARDGDHRLRCYGAAQRGTFGAQFDGRATRVAADCWNYGGALARQGGKLVCLPNLSRLAERRIEPLRTEKRDPPPKNPQHR